MKNIGSVSEYSDDRARDLLCAYRQQLSQSRYISMPEIYEKVVMMPAPRFYVSETRAVVAITKIIKGDQLLYMRPTKREMFFEIYRRYLIEKKKFPHLPLAHLLGIVIEQEAPQFYITPSSAKVYILKAKRKWLEERKRKLYRRM